LAWGEPGFGTADPLVFPIDGPGKVLWGDLVGHLDDEGGLVGRPQPRQPLVVGQPADRGQPPRDDGRHDQPRGHWAPGRRDGTGDTSDHKPEPARAATVGLDSHRRPAAQYARATVPGAP